MHRPKICELVRLNWYEEKQQRKIERLQELADKNKALASSTFDQAHKMAEVIPFGQPILVGHYSERKDRNYRARIDSKMDKACELYDKAKYYEGRVKAAENNNTISSDDPDAIIKLEEKIKEKEKEIEEAKEKKKQLAAIPDDKRDQSFWWAWYLQPSRIANCRTEIRRVKKRIEELGQKEEIPDIDKEINGIRIASDKLENRIRLYFPSKPSEEVRAKLKSRGFRWSYYNNAWQRQISNQAIYLAEQIVAEIQT